MNRDINFLLREYKGYKRGEIRSNKTIRKQMKKHRTNDRLYLFDWINNEYRLNRGQQERVRHLIRRLDFGKFGTMNEEDIITMIALYIRTETDNYSRYKYMLKNKNLTEEQYINFLTTLNHQIRHNS